MGKQKQPPRYRLGVDVGGTHTDFVLNDLVKKTIKIKKLASSPENPALAVLEGVKSLIKDGVNPAEIEFFSHGTTVTTNALLEGKGAKVGLLINHGFRAICEVQTQARDQGNPFDHLFQRPQHITPPSLTYEIPGRMDYKGEELEPVDLEAVTISTKALLEKGVKSFTICYLFSYMNDAHECATALKIRELAPDAFVTISSDVLPRIREWPRYSTTLINAYLVPVLSRYVTDIESGLDKHKVTTQRRFLMQSNGGVMPLSANMEAQTVHTLLSGPAAGVQGAAYLLGTQRRWNNIVTMDMGGTSCDIAFIQGAVPLEHLEAIIANRIVAIPALDVSTISAGGGSIARVNAAGMLDVGPDSAGAIPGPACYGKGGRLPTVTDADIVAGILNPQYFLGGQFSLNKSAASKAIKEFIAKPMALDTSAAAAGISRVINARMADEIRVQAAKKGVDLAHFSLVPFGGAGPAHAAAIAEDLGIPRIIIPSNPGAFSALGLLCADVVHDYVRSDLNDFQSMNLSQVEAAFLNLEKRASVDLKKEGLGEESKEFYREFDLRYAGQGYELRVPVKGIAQPFSQTGLNKMVEKFHSQHEAVHGHSARGAAIEVVSFRLRVRVPVQKIDTESFRQPELSKDHSPIGKRNFTSSNGSTFKADVWRRVDLPFNTLMTGPIIIEQLDATTVVPSGWYARVDEAGNIELTLQD
ncbi:MAG: hydantoinase/oxoprolinase family protein [Pseudomonadota bacterium]|nr:hydantoinase/oxoprolinase family protein [Pseudomonadota bacterium]